VNCSRDKQLSLAVDDKRLAIVGDGVFGLWQRECHWQQSERQLEYVGNHLLFKKNDNRSVG
jgi:hypothetical protein